MKVYYEFDPREDQKVNQLLIEISLKFKYRIMWELRDLEATINEEGGLIRFTEKDGQSTMALNGFTPETIVKIKSILNSMDLTMW